MPMTKRERVLAALNFTGPDRVPIVDAIQHAGVVAHYAGIPERRDWTLEEAAAAVRNCLDMVQDACCLSPSQEKKRWTDANGFTYQSDTWMTSIASRPNWSLDRWTEFLRARTSRRQERTGAAEDIDRRWAGLEALLGEVVLLPAIGFDIPYHSLGWEPFSLMLVDRPEVIADELASQAEDLLDIARHAASPERIPCILIAQDIAHKSGMLLSPVFLREAFFPHVKAVTEALHERGFKVLYHSEGDLSAVMDDLVECGVDGLNPCEPHAGMALDKVHAAYPDLVLWGGIDNAQLLPNGTPDEVRAAVRWAVETMDPTGGYLLGSSGQVHPACSKQNVIAMIETARSMEYPTTQLRET